MPGQPLMFMWETASVMCSSEGQRAIDCQTLKTVTILALRDCPFAKFDGPLFDETFYKKEITFDKFKCYIHRCVEDTSVPFLQVQDNLEAKCWDNSKELYNIKASGFDVTAAKKLWQIYVGLSETGSYPTVVSQEDTNWFIDHMESNLAQNADQPSYPEEVKGDKKKQRFNEFLTSIVHRFAGRYDEVALKRAVEEMHVWLVQEISMAGWLKKRKSKQAYRSGWLQRWFILSPGKLTYYDSPKCEVKKGELLVTSKSVLEEIPTQNKNGLFKKVEYIFKLSIKPNIEMTFSAFSENDYRTWMLVIRDMIDAASKGSTPVQLLLERRRIEKVEETNAILTEMRIRSSTIIRSSTGWYEPDNAGKNVMPGSPHQYVPTSFDDEDFDVESLNNVREKIRVLFNECDADGNGYIDREEFKLYLQRFSQVQFDKEELDEVFDAIDQDNRNKLTFDEFFNYFIKFIVHSSYETSLVEEKLKIDLLKADREGKGSVNFQELLEAAQELKRNEALDLLEETFKEMAESGKNGDVPLEEIRQLLNACKDGSELPAGPKCTVQRRLRSMYHKTELQNMAGYIRDRWDKFASFKRYGASGNLVMKGSSGMIADVLPGQYNLLDLALFSENDAIQPKRVVVKGARWVRSPDPGHSGMIIFPADYDGSIPVDIATSEHAHYYGCHLADSTQVKVSLLYRHGIQDFTYQNNYLHDYVEGKNGPGLEKHEFSHLDCPLEDDSGYFILGKMVKGQKHEELHLTAFIVPTRHTLYVPGNIIHSNDYLKGTWRTMLSDEAEVDHYNLVKRGNAVHNALALPKPFTFKVTGKWAHQTTTKTKEPKLMTTTESMCI